VVVVGVAGVDDVGGMPGLVPSVRLPEDTLASPADALVKLDNVISSSTVRGFFTDFCTGRIPARAQAESSGYSRSVLADWVNPNERGGS
jgi:hypothetical protein